MSTTTRYGRVIKKPLLYEPEEVCDDDYSDDEDEGDEEEDDIDEDEEEEEEEDDEEDADENGNLKDFVVDDEDEDA
jgi:hypothetical protein